MSKIMTSKTYIASLDIGTTTIRCFIIDSSTAKVGSFSSPTQLVYPQPGYAEINPTQLWEQILLVVKNAIADAGLTPKEITCLAISTQRSTFTNWRRDNGECFHNFITWKDIRSKELCKELNSSLPMKIFRWSTYSLYCLSLTTIKRFLTASNLKIAPNHVTGRLLWAIRNFPELNRALDEDNVMFGTLDTWLLYKFTNKHVTDISNASATGFFDPFVQQWGAWAKIFLGIPEKILPQVVANDFNFGSTHRDIFGTAIPIRCVMADQASSLFASCCFSSDDIKLTLGTGAFLNVNTGSGIHTSVTGIYPVIAWRIHDETINMGEVACNDCGTLIEWLLKVGLIDTPHESSSIASQIGDSDGVYFIPAFSGLGPPINDVRSASGFVGIKPTTSRHHLVRSVLEGITFRLCLAFHTLEKERRKEYKHVVVDGGVSNNDFVCQMISDLTGLKLERLNSTELSVVGVGFIAGICAGVWKNKEELKKQRTVQKTFLPSHDMSYRKKCMLHFDQWLDAMDRFKSWYKDE